MGLNVITDVKAVVVKDQPEPNVQELRPPCVLKADGSIVDAKPKNGSNFDLKELQGIVGGYIEIIHPDLPGELVMVINEEGKLKGLPPNGIATWLWAHDVVVGDVLLCPTEMVR